MAELLDQILSSIASAFVGKVINGFLGNVCVYLDSFVFKSGERLYVGVFPVGAVANKFPSSPKDDFVYKTSRGKLISVLLSTGKLH